MSSQRQREDVGLRTATDYAQLSASPIFPRPKNSSQTTADGLRFGPLLASISAASFGALGL